MADPRQDPEHADDGPPADELADFAVVPDPRLAGRVQRSINRHLLAADALELSFDVLVRTTWTHLRVMIESFPRARRGPGTSARENSDE